MDVIHNYIKKTPKNPIFVINQDLNRDVISRVSKIIGSLPAHTNQIQREFISIYNPSNIFDKNTLDNFLTLNQDGILNIDEAVAENPSFKKIMEDGMVTDQELETQAQKVVSMLQDLEKKYGDEQLSEVKALLTEASVLYAVYNIHSIQQIDK